MRIHNMFHDDINRQINGVIKVDQDANEVIEQEVREYVITKELRKHFSAFFNYYSGFTRYMVPILVRFLTIPSRLARN